MIMAFPDSCLLMEDGESCVPYTPDEEKRIIMELMTTAESNLKEGNIYYILSNRWFAAWQQYVGKGSDESFVDDHFVDSHHMNINSCRKANRPQEINNSDLILKGDTCEGDELERQTLLEGHDYVLVPQAVWQKLFEWYKGGPALPRKLISQGNFHKQFNVEVYPLRLVLTDSRDDSQSIIRLSKKASIQELYERVCENKGIKQEEARIWDYFNKQKYATLIASSQTLEELNLQMDQDILLEVQFEDHWQSALDSPVNDLALVPVEPLGSLTIAGGPILSHDHSSDSYSNSNQGSTLTSRFSNLEDGFDSITTTVKKEWKGLAGLQNLGNTCFMNSAIQCLVHTPPLVNYFLEDYTSQINKDNPLGMHGELALAFGELLRKLWSSGRTSIPPRAFKGKLARFAPQFSGYNQHDSQELLAFLLDGLHEDLNRVKQKPYIESKDSDDFPDEVVAEECWMNHKARNDSVIVDVCQGQYKSTLICPVCGKVSITFDPFMYLSLPLPSTATRTMTVTIFYGDGSGLPMPFTVTVLKLGCCKDLTSAVGAACCLSLDETLLFAEVYDNRIYRYFENPHEPLSSIKNDEHIVAYRLLKKCLRLRKMEILHRCSENARPGEKRLLGAPLVTYIDESEGRDGVRTCVERVIRPLRKNVSTKFENGKRNGVACEAVDEVGMSWKELELKDDERVMRVTVDWGEREHKLYDASYLRDLPEVCSNTGFGVCVKKMKPEAISLFSCLEAFLREEPLGPDDMWYCPECKEHRQASKKLDLWRLPHILVFHLKRFSYSRYLKNKLDTFVNFPIQHLDLAKYVKGGNSKDDHVYELYAISNHYGGLGGGHYSAHAKLIDENRWYHFDDTHVSPVGEEDVRTSAAYVLFYRRKMVVEDSQ